MSGERNTSENERAHARDEAGEEGVERESADESAVDELDDTSEHDVEEEEINELDPLRRGLPVRGEELRDGLHGWVDKSV